MTEAEHLPHLDCIPYRDYGPSAPVECDFCHGVLRAKELALSLGDLLPWYGSGPPQGVPRAADICGQCAQRPMTDLLAYFGAPQPRTEACERGACNHYPATAYHPADCPPALPGLPDLDCPECGTNCPYLNAGRTHVGYCRRCQVSWLVGSNLFSSWQDQTEEEQRAAWEAAGIERMRRVEPSPS